MVTRRKVLVVFGTRPEAIKLAPVIERLRERPDDFDVRVCVTAQHREMLDQVLELFGIVPDADLDVMQAGQTLSDLTARALTGLTRVFESERPDVVVVQGDTTTTFTAALAAFYLGIPVAHVEAGLRSGDPRAPFPEELNRVMTSRLAAVHFAPTSVSRDALLREGIDPGAIHVTGNTVIDALLETAGHPYEFASGPIADVLAGGRRIVVVTLHRRENWGEPSRRVFEAIAALTRRFPDIEVVFAVHRNPRVRDVAAAVLSGVERVHLVEPLAYLPFVKLLAASTLIVSDSGGIQEEAPSLGKPVLVLRDVTERPEAVDAGTVLLVGTDPDRIVAEAAALLDDAGRYAEMARRTNPFGDGTAAARIADVLAGVRPADGDRPGA